MKTPESFYNYIEKLKKDIIFNLKKRVIFIIIKEEIQMDLKDKEDFIMFEKFLKRQEAMVKSLKKRKAHIRNYAIKQLKLSKMDKISKEILLKELKNAELIYTWLYSETRFLNHQRVALKNENIFLRKNGSKVMHKIRKMLRRDLKSQIIKEEHELALAIKVFEKSRKKLKKYSSEILRLEKLSQEESFLLKSALFFNALPFHGLGDMLSLPFWLLDGLFRAYEHSFKEYHGWKSTQNRNIKELEKELNKIKVNFN